MELILVRHTKVNVETGTCYGQRDVNLAETFEAEKDIILKNLNTEDAKVISSPLKRCTRLADCIKQEFDTDNRIMELNFGKWELQRWDEINDPELDIWMDDYIAYRCPNGESLLDMKNRVNHFFTDLRKQNHQKYIIITHGGVIRLFHHLIDGVDLKAIFNIRIGFGEIHSFKI